MPSPRLTVRPAVLNPDTITDLASALVGKLPMPTEGFVDVAVGGIVAVLHADGRVGLSVSAADRWSLGRVSQPGSVEPTRLASELREILCVPADVSPFSRRLHRGERL